MGDLSLFILLVSSKTFCVEIAQNVRNLKCKAYHIMVTRPFDDMLNFHFRKRVLLLSLKLQLWEAMIELQHSCQPLLGVNISPEFVNLYFLYAGRKLHFSLVAVTF